jgi:hypothetical protein
MPAALGSSAYSGLLKTNSSTPVSNILATNSGAAIPSPTNSTNAPSEFIVSNGEKYLVVSFAQLAAFIFKITPENPSADSDSLTTAQIREQVPAAVRSLSEKSVALTGFMLPGQTQNCLATDFLLLRNQSACCYGIMPKPNEWAAVRTAGKGVKITMDRPVTVLGTFHVRAMRENGTLASIYQLDCEKLINPKE